MSGLCLGSCWLNHLRCNGSALEILTSDAKSWTAMASGLMFILWTEDHTDREVKHLAGPAHEA